MGINGIENLFPEGEPTNLYRNGDWYVDPETNIVYEYRYKFKDWMPVVPLSYIPDSRREVTPPKK